MGTVMAVSVLPFLSFSFLSSSVQFMGSWNPQQTENFKTQIRMKVKTSQMSANLCMLWLKIKPDFVVLLDCSEEEMTRRLLNRNPGRVDDNIDTIKKRFKVYQESTVPVVNYHDTKEKVRKIDAERSIDEVFESIKGVFTDELNSAYSNGT